MNPDMDIIVYTSNSSKDNLVQWKTKDHTEKITRMKNMQDVADVSPKVKIISIDFGADLGLDNDMSPVYKADFIRIYKMHEHGGIWFDFDILFIKPIPCFFFESDDTDLFCFLWADSKTKYATFTTGFTASIPKLPFFRELLKKALQALKSPTSTDYMKIGPDLWKQTFLDMKLFNNRRLKRVSNQTVYPYDWLQITEFVTTNIDRVSDDTFCIHWFNGNNEIRKVENEIDIENIDKTKSTLHKYLHNVFTTI
jgi:hypothetical protein